MGTKHSLFAVAVIVLAACASPHYTATHEEIEQRIANARTRTDHLSLAGLFEKEAQEAKKRAEMHRAMSRVYADPAWSGRGSWLELRGHCDELVQLYEKSQQENLALAAQHRQFAREVPQ